jgi:hypothetical protein
VLASEDNVRAELVQMGRRRVRELDPGTGRSNLVDHLRAIGA